MCGGRECISLHASRSCQFKLKLDYQYYFLLNIRTSAFWHIMYRWHGATNSYCKKEIHNGQLHDMSDDKQLGYRLTVPFDTTTTAESTKTAKAQYLALDW